MEESLSCTSMMMCACTCLRLYGTVGSVLMRSCLLLLLLFCCVVVQRKDSLVSCYISVAALHELLRSVLLFIADFYHAAVSQDVMQQPHKVFVSSKNV